MCFFWIKKILKETRKNIKNSKFAFQNLSNGFTPFILFLFIGSSFLLYSYMEIIYGNNETDLIKILNFYLLIVLLRLFAYRYLFKKISFFKSQFRSNSFVPLFILPAEIVFVFFLVKKTEIQNFMHLDKAIPILNKLIENEVIVTILFFFLLFYIFSKRDKYTIFKIPFYYTALGIEMFLISTIYYIFASHYPRIFFVTKEVIIYVFLIFYFLSFINKTQKTILKTKNKKFTPGNLIKLDGTIIEEIHKKIRYEIFLFKFERSVNMYKVKNSKQDFFIIKPELRNLNIDHSIKIMTSGDKISIIGIFNKYTEENEKFEFIIPLYLEIKQKSVSRQFF